MKRWDLILEILFYLVPYIGSNFAAVWFVLAFGKICFANFWKPSRLLSKAEFHSHHCYRLSPSLPMQLLTNNFHEEHCRELFRSYHQRPRPKLVYICTFAFNISRPNGLPIRNQHWFLILILKWQKMWWTNPCWYHFLVKLVLIWSLYTICFI